MYIVLKCALCHTENMSLDIISSLMVFSHDLYYFSVCSEFLMYLMSPCTTKISNEDTLAL